MQTPRRIRISLHEKVMDKFEIVIETPGGSRAKYKYDTDKKHFAVKKLLPAGMVFPYDFGYIPGTTGEDGDPIDALVLSEFTTFTGCHIECRLIGALLAEQGKNEIRNDRFIFIPTSSFLFEDIKSINDLSEELVKQLTDFFINYNKAEGKQFEPLGLADAEKAGKMINAQKK
jgi:inorganic pyrophosphatase